MGTGAAASGPGAPLQAALADAGLVGWWDYDPGDDVVRCDEAVARMLAFDPEVAGRGLPHAVFLNRIHVEDRALVRARCRAACEGASGFRAEFRTGTGPSALWIQGQGRGIRDGSGRVIRVRGIALDITEYKREPKPEPSARTTDLETRTRAALRAVLDSPAFQRSPQLARFLAYVVEEHLAGRGEAIKAYSIATGAFDRPPDFDPGADPIVRVEARRLRAALEEFYADPARPVTMRIGVPVGSYRPTFAPAVPMVPPDEPPPAAPLPERAPPGRAWSGGGLPLILLVIAIVLLLLDVGCRILG